MPTYSYTCSCGVNKDLAVPVESRDSQVCEVCGKQLKRVFAVPRIIFRQTGREMALDSLNSRGNGLPNDRYKARYQEGVVAGLTPRKNKFIGKGHDFTG